MLMIDQEVREVIAEAMHRCLGDFVTTWEEIEPRLSREDLCAGSNVTFSIDGQPLVEFRLTGPVTSVYSYLLPQRFTTQLTPIEPDPNPDPDSLWPGKPHVRILPR